MMVPLDGVGPAGLSTRNSLHELNAQQQEAVVHAVQLPRSSPLLVIAGAGSGKTKTLAHRVAQLILAGADPRRILLLTFTRRAAQQMTRRSADLLDVVRTRLGLAKLDRRFPKKATCLAIYSSVVNTQRSLQACLLKSFPW